MVPSIGAFGPRRRWERGGAAALVAVILGGGVFLGVSALALDVGSIWWERRQLQNAADSASLAVGEDCAAKAATCNPTSTTITSYSSKNVADKLASNDGACVRFTTGLPSSWAGKTCASATDTSAQQDQKAGTLTECLPLPAWLKADTGLNYVEVKVGTGSGTTQTPLAGIFSRAVTGKDNPHVSSCARAAWGPIGGATTLPLTFAKCEYTEAMTPPKGGYGVETALPLKYGKKVTACADTASSGGDFDGGFGWLTSVVGCQADVDANSWVDAQTGVGGGSGCYDQFKPGSTIFIPIYDCVSDSNAGNAKPCVSGSPSGTHTWYHIDGFATFYVTGVDITGKADFLSGYPGSSAKNECKNESLDNKCLYGWFLEKYIPAAEFLTSGGSDYGSPGVVPAG